MSRIRPKVSWLIVLLAALSATFASGAGSGGGGGYSGDMGPSTGASKTPQQIARDQYKAGLRHKQKAWKLEEKAAKATKESDKTKHLANAQKEYTRSIDNYLKAIRADRAHFEAMNELGYAYRKTGDYQNALKAYNTALLVKPEFPEAIEYRGEAYLALGLFDKTKEAYLALLRDSPENAAKLMQAMEAWLSQQSGELTAEAAAFSGWVQERKALVGQSQSLSMSNGRAW